MNFQSIWDFIVEYRKTIITIIVILVILVIIKRNWYRVRQFLNPQAEDKVPESLSDPSQPGGLSNARKIYIEGLANDLHEDIESTSIWGHDYEPYSAALALYDDEIKYLGKYFRDFITKGDLLSEWIDSQYYTWSSTPHTLSTKLKSYNL